MNTKPIGIFDSGVGGLTVLHQMLEQLPKENYVYFGDSARVPYGSKSKEAIIKYSIQDVNFLISKDVKIIVIACNSASSNSIDALKEKFSLPIFGVIDPVINALDKSTKKIGIIGTYATIESGIYRKKIENLGLNIDIFEKPCPLFVPLAEEGLVKGDIANRIIDHYLNELKDMGIDSLILACTHYPLLIDAIDNFFGGNIRLIDPSFHITEEVKLFLHGSSNDNTSGGKIEFFLSDIPRNFSQITKNFLGVPINSCEKINIERF